MSLAEEYGRQLPWREWPRVLDALPPLEGRLVLDLGCAIGDQAAALAARGARVVGVDVNEELLAVARGRSIPRADFRQHDLRALPDLGLVADGIWCSLSPAFFPDLPAALRSWARHLRPGGFAALVEIDDLWGHEPLGAPTRRILDAYAAEALAAGRYDMHMGRKLGRHLEAAGFTVTASFALEDRELSFAGPARPDVIEAWRLRLERLKPLRELCGDRFEAVRADFLACLARLDHRCTASVQCCIAVR